MVARKLIAVAGAVLSGVVLTSVPNVLAAPGSALFDDFSYTGSGDARLGQRGWTLRSGGEGPGVPGAVWDPARLTFPKVDGSTVMRMDSWTNGSSARQTEVQQQQKFFEGTYATRIKFSDAPEFGPDGDRLVQTFFTITPLNSNMDPDYGEIDFEYLPNGGWGEPSSLLYSTTWETYQASPWIGDNTSTKQRRSYAGWHDLMVQVGNGRVKYFVDGVQVADHGDKFYPETPMAIKFNQWFIAGGLVPNSAERSYQQEVDYVYFAENRVLSPAEVRAEVHGYREAGVEHVNTM